VEQIQEKVRSPARAETVSDEAPPVITNPELDDAIDGILDEIDSVLEKNAADFVKNYKQEGGQ
jgi:prokaryotic ubiquitin-like protein Pup